MKAFYLTRNLLTCIFCIGAMSGYSKIIYVNATATGADNGTSWADAYTKLQKAVNKASAGDAVYVAAGTYKPAYNASFSMKEGVKIYGGFAGTETALEERNWKTNVTILKGNNTRVINNWNNGLTTAAVLDGFTITGGKLTYGAGMNNYYASPAISNCIFTKNSADGNAGGGMYNLFGSPTISNCLFSDNYALSGGGICNLSCNPVISNCLFAGNTANVGAEIFKETGTGTLKNVTLINSAANAYHVLAGPDYWYNSIIWGAIDGTLYYPASCLIKGSSGTANGNIDATGYAPKDIFKNYSGKDYTLKYGGPCIDAGNNSYASGTKDLNTNPRIFNGTVDLGAYEYNGIVYVNKTAAPGGNGGSWASAFTSLTDATAAVNNDTALKQIWVASGTYQPASGQSFSMVKGVKIYGGFTSTEAALEQRNWKINVTVLKGNGSSVIRNYSNGLTSTALLDGFIITGGGGESQGGGIYNLNVSPTISNCIFYNNQANVYGGGMFNENASTAVNNCLFYGNSAVTGGSEIANYSGNGSFKNVTVANNAVNAFFAYGYTFWHNSIIWGSINGTGYSTASCLIKGSNSTANGNIDATGLTDAGIFYNPAGYDYTLKSGSPCIDAGNNSYVTGTTDLKGNNRILNDIVDVGAYESDFNIPDANGIMYVDSAVASAGNGSSWAKALASLTDAITAAVNDTAIKQIWIANGTYQPVSGQSFSMVKGVKIYGGFAGTETSVAQRNWKTNATILKGNGSRVILNNGNGITSAALLDGFIITGGNGFYGGGMENYQVSPTISNCIFYNNQASISGGGMYNYNSSPAVDNTLFYGNSAGTIGSEISNSSGNGSFRNVTVVNNAADAFYAYGYTFWYNSIIWGGINGTGYSAASCLIKGSSSTANGNIDATGLTDAGIFSNPVGYDYTLKSGSPCIDAGNNSYGVGATDLNGNNRIINGIVDAGAYEAKKTDVLISVADISQPEKNKGTTTMTFLVSLNKKTNKQVTVDYATKNGNATAGSDYIAQSGTVVFPAGNKSPQPVAITINGDKITEPDEKFKLVLSNPVNAVISDGTAIGTIVNDDSSLITVGAANEQVAVTLTQSLMLSPNPARDNVQVILAGYSGNVTIRLGSGNGSMLKEYRLQVSSLKQARQQINTGSYPDGLYYITVIDIHGKKKTEKLVIIH